jgi:hypothetical protein
VPVVRQEAVLYCDRGCAMRMVMCDVQSVGRCGGMCAALLSEGVLGDSLPSTR